MAPTYTNAFLSKSSSLTEEEKKEKEEEEIEEQEREQEEQDEQEEEEEEDEEEKIVLHVYDDESKEFTSLTTYHGMIRIYTSETWPSRIFWGVVVVTCVTLFMIQGGVLLQFYHSQPTATKTDEVDLPLSFLPSISICPQAFRNNDELFNLIVNQINVASVNSTERKQASRDLLIQNSFACNEVVETIYLNSVEKTHFCESARTLVTDMGVCFTFDDWPSIGKTPLKIILHSNFTKKYTAHVHSKSDNPSRWTKHFFFEHGKSSQFIFSIEESKYLNEEDWGTCKKSLHGDTYSYYKCFENCLIQDYNSSCGCSPFFQNSVHNYCTVEQIEKCNKFYASDCTCPVQCNYRSFIARPSNTIMNTAGTTSVKFILHSSKLTTHQQYKRFKQIDLMSYIGGVMGLFLGMSCITLLEVFIYLLKTIFGTLNNTRHELFAQQYSSSNDSLMDGSHEEIIITKKSDKRKQAGDEILDDVGIGHSADNFYHNQLNLESLAPTSVKLQLYRPNRTLKRNSVYLGTCDF